MIESAVGAQSTEEDLPRGWWVWVLLAQYAVWLALYLGVNAATEGRSAFQPILPFERRIPLVTAAYPVYASVYLEIALPLFLARTRAGFARMQVAVALASLLAFAVFLVAPMPYPRPALAADGGGLTPLLALEYRIDHPRCTFPSLHVAIAVLLYLGLRGEAPRWRWPLLALAVAVSLSTLLVKQHFLADVVAGALLAAGAWWVAPRVMAQIPPLAALAKR